MDKLELKHLKHYLGAGLKCYVMGECTIESEGTDDEKPQLFQIEGISNTWVEVSGRLDTVTDEIHIEDCIPHLLPLSSLTEPLPDGSIPIVELAKICFENIFTTKPIFLSTETLKEHDSSGLIAYTEDDRVSLSYNKDFNRNEFEFWIAGNEMHVNQLQLFECLFANHFDVYSLIDAGLAIDKRTL